MKHTGRNQNGDVVALATRSCLMWTRDAHTAAQQAHATGKNLQRSSTARKERAPKGRIDT